MYKHMNYIFLIKYVPWFKDYKRQTIQESFKNKINEFLIDNSFIKVKCSQCKRYWVDDVNHIIIRMGYKMSYKMGYSNYSQSLEHAMRFYVKKGYHIISVEKQILDISQDVKKYLDSLKKAHNKPQINIKELLI